MTIFLCLLSYSSWPSPENKNHRDRFRAKPCPHVILVTDPECVINKDPAEEAARPEHRKDVRVSPRSNLLWTAGIL